MDKLSKRLKEERRHSGFGNGEKLNPIDLPTSQQQDDHENDSQVPSKIDITVSYLKK